jgi:hypothetical protein
MIALVGDHLGVTVHLAPRQLWLIDLGRVFKGFPGYSGLPSNGICDSLQA